MEAVVQIPAFQEGRRVYDTARQLRDQTIPTGWEVDVQAWVTLDPPDRELCDTWQAAVEAEGVEVYEAPRGKLSARNSAHDLGLNKGYDVIVSWDADAPPVGDGVLSAMLEGLEEPDVVCVNSRPLSSVDGMPLSYAVDALAALEDVAVPHVHGQAHGFLADVWADAGPFDETVDQTDITEVRAEEEFAFYRRLREHGRVVTHPDVVVYNDPRRHLCKVPGMGDEGYCSERGVKTFQRPPR